MKILHILNTSVFSGAENVVCQIISLFREDSNIEMAYCSPDGKIRESLAERDIEFYPIKAMKVSELKRVIKEYKPDIIHAHDMRACFFASLACEDITLISHIHNNAFESRRITVKSIAYLFAARKASHIFWVSKSACDGYCFKRFVKKKSEILYNIVDRELIIARAEKDKMQYDYDAVYIGRMSFPKNPKRMIDVFSKAVKLKSDIRIAVIGIGEMLEEVTNYANELHLGENVHFLGFMSNPLKCLKNARVMLMTSRYEGTPMCVLEAMALGVPVVSTPVDGIKVLLGECGDLLSENDDELASMIVRMIEDDEYRTLMSDKVRTRFDECCDKREYKERLYEAYIKDSISGI